MRFKRHFLLPLLTVALAGLAQDLDKVATDLAADLKASLAELADVRQAIETERIPLARKLADLERSFSDRKAEYAKAQQFQENQLVELNRLKADARRRADEVKYVESLLSEYARAFRSRLAFVEEQRYAPTLDAADRAAASADISAAERFTERAKLLTTALQRVEATLGGEVFASRALDKQGRVQSGKVALIGPVAMFASDDGALAGVLQMELNKSDPSVVLPEQSMIEGSRDLVAGGAGLLALDATLGNAFKLSALKEPIHERLAKGGMVMIPLLLLGFCALLLAVVKWIQLARVRLTSERDLQEVLTHLEKNEPSKAFAHARSVAGLAGDLLATAVQHVDEKKEYLEEILYEKMLGARIRLERGLPFLALTATAGPLMGLLGTVMGMIATFRLISSFGSGDPKLLAAGISEALIATATGMAVAIPALLAHAFLSRKAKSILGSMEQTSVGFINGLPQPSEESLFVR